MRLKISEIEKTCVEKLTKRGMAEPTARLVFAEFLDGELSGKVSHGLMSFVPLAKRVEEKRNPAKIVEESDSYALVDGGADLGQINGKLCMELAMKKARKSGIAFVGLYNSRSILRPGWYAQKARENELIGIIFDDSASRVVAPGGKKAVLGTNPLAVGIPTKSTPFVVDMATSIRAMGEIRLAKKLGEPLPEGWAIDKDGNPTTDPNEFYAYLPLGGYKGFALGLVLEVMAGALIRARMGGKMTADQVSNLGRGFVFMCIDPTKFRDLEEFKEEVEEYLQEVKASGEGVRIPGERAEALRQKALEAGEIEVDDKIWNDVLAL